MHGKLTQTTERAGTIPLPKTSIEIRVCLVVKSAQPFEVAEGKSTRRTHTPQFHDVEPITVSFSNRRGFSYPASWNRVM